jgi:hypothetical protein
MERLFMVILERQHELDLELEADPAAPNIWRKKNTNSSSCGMSTFIKAEYICLS